MRYNDYNTQFRTEDDSWWSMTQDYYKLLSRFKVLFSQFYFENDGANMLKVLEIEWLHVFSNFLEGKYQEKVDLINKGLLDAKNILGRKSPAGSRGDEVFEKNNLEAIKILYEVMKNIYLLEADKGMLQRKQESTIDLPDEEW